MSAYTKGPWELVPQTSGGDLVAHRFETGNQMNPTGLRLIAFMMSRGSSLREDQANARLIAAAPELLEALEMMVATGAPVGTFGEVAYEKSVAALAKAGGK